VDELAPRLLLKVPIFSFYTIFFITSKLLTYFLSWIMDVQVRGSIETSIRCDKHHIVRTRSCRNTDVHGVNPVTVLDEIGINPRGVSSNRVG